MKTKTIIDLLTVTVNGHDNPLTVGQAVIDTLRELPREDVERAIWGESRKLVSGYPEDWNVTPLGTTTTTETGFVYHPDPLAPLKLPMLDELCRKCGGSGDVITRRSYGIDGGYMYSAEVCEACHGEGKEITNTNSGNATEG